MKTKLNIIFLAIGVAVAIVVLAAFFASSSPDGLEKVAESQGFADKAEENIIDAPVPDYLFPGIRNKTFSTVLAGISGILLILGGSFLFSKLSRKN